jgi:hypothetical protein
MDDDIAVLERIYDRFNARDIDSVLASLADDVAWANGMDGGHVHGREAVREYWTRQRTMVSPHVEPVNFHRTTVIGRYLRSQRRSRTSYSMRVAELHVSSKIPTTQ